MDPYKARKVAKIIAIIVAIAMVVTSFSFIVFIPSMLGMQGTVVYAETAAEDEYLEQQTDNLEQYMKYIKTYYKDEVSYIELINGAFTGVIEALDDPYSIYYGNNGGGDDFIESVSGEFSGIGVSVENYNGQCRVVAPISGAPAERAGVKSGDIIIKVNGIDITKKTLDEAVALMKGDAGTKVTIMIKRETQVLDFTLIREAIKNISVTNKMLDNKIGYIKISSFDNDTDTEFKAARESLANKGAKSLILDVRNNPGGLINSAANLANQIMPKGPITHFEQKGKIVETISADGTAVSTLPMVLLVNEGSASASEILAGALQDTKRATLVGTTTYGKGVAQQITTFSNGASMKLSTYYFLTPNETRIDHIGIIPDYTVQNSANVDADELTDQYMNFAPMSEKVKPKAGDTGLNVYGAQQRLHLLGYTVDINGTMDMKTVDGIKKFQTQRGLYSYGVLDYTTMGTIDKAVQELITGAGSDKDLQLEKAVDLLQ